MKIVFHSPGHRKNTEAIKQMCKEYNFDLEFTHCFERIKRDDYDILIMNCNFIEPSLIPSNIKIIYGPQLWVFPEGEIVGELDSKVGERAVFNSLSKWNTIRLLEDYKRPLRVPCVEFPFSVDIQKFYPQECSKEIDCIFYFKNRKTELHDYVYSKLVEKKLNFVKLVYGSYNESDYINLLQKSKFMVVLDASESQGFALEEAMSCNVPLLVIDALSMYDECPDGKHASHEKQKPLPLRATSVPYWSDECGIRITDIQEFDKALDKMRNVYSVFTPRIYVERELSPEKCMRRILEYFPDLNII